MDIACPNCAATYRVPDSLLAQGKALRCAACGHEWVPEASSRPTAPPDLPPIDNALATPIPPPAPPDAVDPPEEVAPRPAAPRPTPPTTPPPLQRRNTPGLRPVTPPRAVERASGRLLPLAWLASVTVVLLALLALVIFGEDIAAAWPPFGRVTALISG